MLEGASLANETTFPIHGYNDANYTYEARGNLKTRPVQLTTGGFAIPGQTLTWDVENRLDLPPAPFLLSRFVVCVVCCRKEELLEGAAAQEAVYAWIWWMV